MALVAHAIHDHGGMERVCAELIRRAAGRVEFVVISRDLAPDLRPLVEWRRIPVPSRPVPLKFTTFFALAALEVARAKADLVHTVGALVPNRTDLAAVHFCHAGWYRATGTLAPRDAPLPRRVNTGIQRTLAIAAERWCYRPGRVQTLAAVSKMVATELERHYPGVRVVVTPNGVNAERFRPDPHTRRKLRSCLGAGEHDIVALFVGGDWDRKGLRTAIEGLAAARATGADTACLWVVGPGDSRRFADIAATAGVGHATSFFGHQPDPAPFYQAADLLLVPSSYEAFSLALVEGAAAGLPLVTADVGVAREVVGHGKGGVIVRPTPTDVGQAIAHLALHPDERTRMSAAVHRRASAFSWDASIEIILAEYERLLALRSTTGKAVVA